MSFLSPWALLFGLAGAGLVLLFHMLRPPRRELTVSSVLLWRQFSETLAVTARWRRIVRTLLLLCHLGLVAAVGLALAGPQLFAGRLQGTAMIVLDTSASMQATDVPPSRLAWAKSAAVDVLAEARERTFIVVAAGPRPAILYQGGRKSEAREAIQAASPVDGSADWARVADLIRRPDATRVAVVTDGATSAAAFAPVIEAAGGTFEWIRPPVSGGSNTGIIAFEARPLSLEAPFYEVLVTVGHYGPAPVVVPLAVRSERNVLHQSVLELQPGEEAEVVFNYAFTGEATLHASLDVTDHLQVDDEAYLVAREPSATHVLVVGPGSTYLEQVLSVFPDVIVDRRLMVRDDLGDAYHLTIFDRAPVPDGYAGRALVLGVAETNPRFNDAAVTWWHQTHPLSRFVDWNGLAVARAGSMPQGRRTPLVESSAGTLVQLRQTEQGERIEFAFTLEGSNLPRLVAWPVLMAHIIEWAHPAGRHAVRNPQAPGETIRIGTTTGTPRVVAPDGSNVPLQPGDTAFVADRSGLYTVWLPSGLGTPLAVAPPGAVESDVRPRLSLPQASPSDTAPAPRVEEGAMQAAPGLLLAALALLGVETWLYANRGRRPVPKAVRARETGAPAGGRSRGGVHR